MAGCAVLCAQDSFPESDHPYTDNLDKTWSYVYGDATAKSIRVTFDWRTETEPGRDFIYIVDGDGRDVDGSPFTGAQLSGQSKTIQGRSVQIRLVTSAAGHRWGFKVASVSVPGAVTATVFLIHGIAQGADAMKALADSLNDPHFGLDRNRFTVDSGFDWSVCANDRGCAPTCTIEGGARELAGYIRSRSRELEKIILVGYSLGGLIARTALLNNFYSIGDTRQVVALVTLGSPHRGYPYLSVDGLARCKTLAAQMDGDLRFPQMSPFLAGLNDGWESRLFPGRPGAWFAAAGTFCADATRPLTHVGCLDSSPRNDGIVCGDSAILKSGGRLRPPEEWTDDLYCHTTGLGTLLVFCRSTGNQLIPLYAPPPGSSLLRAIREFIHGL